MKTPTLNQQASEYNLGNSDKQQRLSIEATTARALTAAIYDKHLEEQGITVEYFFDADVVIGSLFARDELAKDMTNLTLQNPNEDILIGQPISRAAVRALWAQGFMAPVVLATPHLNEFNDILQSIESAGGVINYLRQRHSTISHIYGLHSTRRYSASALAIINTIRRATSANDREVITRLQSLGIYEFAAIEAEACMYLFSRPGAFDGLFNTRTDPGENEESLKKDDRFRDVVSTIRNLRSSSKKRSTSISDGRDACTLISISRRWQAYHEAASSNNESPSRVPRFYTQTDALRKFLSHSPENADLGPRLITDPSCNFTDSTTTDSIQTALRSSTYMLIRSTFPSLAFNASRNSISASSDFQYHQEIENLFDLTNRLLEERKYLPPGESRPPSPLYELFSSWINAQFTSNLIRYRSNSISELLIAARDSYWKTSKHPLMDAEQLLPMFKEVGAAIDRQLTKIRNNISDTLLTESIVSTFYARESPRLSELEMSAFKWGATISNADAVYDICDAMHSLFSKNRVQSTSYLSDSISSIMSINTIQELPEHIPTISVIDSCGHVSVIYNRLLNSSYFDSLDINSTAVVALLLMYTQDIEFVNSNWNKVFQSVSGMPSSEGGAAAAHIEHVYDVGLGWLALKMSHNFIGRKQWVAHIENRNSPTNNAPLAGIKLDNPLIIRLLTDTSANLSNLRLTKSTTADTSTCSMLAVSLLISCDLLWLSDMRMPGSDPVSIEELRTQYAGVLEYIRVYKFDEVDWFIDLYIATQWAEMTLWKLGEPGADRLFMHKRKISTADCVDSWQVRYLDILQSINWC